MRKTRHEIGMINGIPYKLSFDQLGNQQYCDDRYKKLGYGFYGLTDIIKAIFD